MENFSQRVNDVSENPKFLISDINLINQSKVGDGTNGKFSLHFDVANSNGSIDLIGEIDSADDAYCINNLKYVTNVKGPSLAFLDTLVQFCHGKNGITVSHITVREIDYFLRDTNSTPAFPDDGISMYRVFEILKPLQKELLNFMPQVNDSLRASPSFDHYQKSSPIIFNPALVGSFLSLPLEVQHEYVARIFTEIVTPYLEKDGGGIECCHIMDNLIVVNFLGNCTSCSMSLTTTMDFVQDVLRIELETPDLQIMSDN